MKVDILTKDDKTVNIEVPPAGDVSSFFVFSMFKAGSVLQDKVIEDICAELDIPTVSIPKAAFGQGINDNLISEKSAEDIFGKPGYCFYGFRYLPHYLNGIKLETYKKLFLIRDPRDMLVSHYFSMKKSHPIPAGNVGEKLKQQRQQLESLDIDSYVLEKSSQFLGIFNRYQKIDDGNLAMFRYEDIVFEKKRWITEILDFLEISLAEDVIEKIAANHDIFPQKEDTSSHIRKVSPGDHKEKLKAETIEKLNDKFQFILKKYKYA